MEYEKIKELINDMGNSKLSSLEISFPDGTKISMKKEEKEVIVQTTNKIVTENKNETSISSTNDNELEENIITSPMVGTFYAKPSPDSKPYVEVGTKVKKGDIVCIVEAMKLMNEIESEFDGEIIEILVKEN